MPPQPRWGQSLGGCPCGVTQGLVLSLGTPGVSIWLFFLCGSSPVRGGPSRFCPGPVSRPQTPFHSCAFCPLHPSFLFIFSGGQTWGPFNSSKVREGFFIYYFFSKLRIPPSCFPVFPYRAAGSRTTVDFSLTSPSLFSTERARRYSRRLSKLQMTRL